MIITKSKLRQLIREELVNQEKNKTLLREGLTAIFSKLFTGGIENIKENIAKKIMEELGVDTDSIIAKVFINFIGNLEVQDIIDLLAGDNSCLIATGELVEAINETIVEQLPEAIGLDTSGFFAGALREALVKTLTQDFNDRFAEALCELDYRPLLKGIPGAEFLSKLL